MEPSTETARDHATLQIPGSLSVKRFIPGFFATVHALSSLCLFTPYQSMRRYCKCCESAVRHPNIPSGCVMAHAIQYDGASLCPRAGWRVVCGAPKQRTESSDGCTAQWNQGWCQPGSTPAVLCKTGRVTSHTVRDRREMSATSPWDRASLAVYDCRPSCQHPREYRARHARLDIGPGVRRTHVARRRKDSESMSARAACWCAQRATRIQDCTRRYKPRRRSLIYKRRRRAPAAHAILTLHTRALHSALHLWVSGVHLGRGARIIARKLLFQGGPRDGRSERDTQQQLARHAVSRSTMQRGLEPDWRDHRCSSFQI